MNLLPGIQSHSRISGLDGIRGLSILIVVFSHVFYSMVVGTSASPVLFKEIMNMGLTGVDLFFVLSGFLIGGILMDHRDSEHYFKTFYVRRVCRIVPVYYVWLGLGWLLTSKVSSLWNLNNFFTLTHCPGWSYLVFIQNFWIAKIDQTVPIWVRLSWSLCIEEQFYLLMPLIIWLVSPRKLPVVLTALIFLTFLFRSFLCIYTGYFVYYLAPCRVDALLAGVLCACLLRNPRYESLIKRRLDWLYLIFTLLFCGMVYFTISPQTRGEHNSFDISTWGNTWIALFYASFLLIVVTDKTGPFARVMRNALLRHLAVISYCVYLIFLPINGFAHDLLFKSGFMAENIFSNLLAVLLGLFITWLVATLSWKYLERPIVEWGHSFIYGDSSRLQNKVVVSPANSSP